MNTLLLTRPQVEQLAQVSDDLDIPVVCYGLRTDFQGNLFPGSAALPGWADNLTELKTICHCGRKATMILRSDEKGTRSKKALKSRSAGTSAMCQCVESISSKRCGKNCMPVDEWSDPGKLDRVKVDKGAGVQELSQR